MPLNPDDYRHHFTSFDLTREQETAMIEALITIAEAVADLAWGVHPRSIGKWRTIMIPRVVPM